VGRLGLSGTSLRSKQLVSRQIAVVTTLNAASDSAFAARRITAARRPARIKMRVMTGNCRSMLIVDVTSPFHQQPRLFVGDDLEAAVKQVESLIE
jgi:hypothetical protein